MLALAALVVLVTPVAAAAADVAAPGLGSGVYAAAGAFLGQLASSAVSRRVARRAVASHEERCRAYRFHRKGDSP